MSVNKMFVDLENTLSRYGYVLVGLDESQRRVATASGRVERVLKIEAVHAFREESIKGQALVEKR